MYIGVRTGPTRTSRCCGNGCLQCIDNDILQRVWLNVCCMSYKTQKSWLLTTVSACHCPANDKFIHTLGRKQLCTKAFIIATGIFKSRYYEVRKQFLLGHLRVERMESKRFHVATNLAIQWLNLYAKENGDKLPNQEKILLPSSLTKVMVYNNYAEEYSSMASL